VERPAINNSMKLLKSKYDEWDGMKVVPLKIDNLWASVPKAEVHRGKQFYGPVMKDIEANGLHFPLLIVEATHAQLIKEKRRYKDKMLDLPFDEKNTNLDEKIYVVWGGSNRVRAAAELGFDYIDCVIFTNGRFDLAKSKQKLHRKPYMRKFY
jgi:hypothetical protein